MEAENSSRLRFASSMTACFAASSLAFLKIPLRFVCLTSNFFLAFSFLKLGLRLPTLVHSCLALAENLCQMLLAVAAWDGRLPSRSMEMSSLQKSQTLIISVCKHLVTIDQEER